MFSLTELQRSRLRCILTLLLVTFAISASGQTSPKPTPPSLILLTLDTTRSDAIGAYGAPSAQTPVLDDLATRGARYARAIAPSPLTLPAHASLLTGLTPPEHGVRDNGTAILPEELPTLATTLKSRGYATGAFVASRVLDRRFGLARGFDAYGDRMVAEQIGQYGYPERDAAAVTSDALAWVSQLPDGKPYFLWVHYYDPHAPYQPPEPARTQNEWDAYAGEIAYADREIGRLLAGLPAGEQLVAAVGDHGEMLGEHGETGHGIFLYRAALEVPLILAGPKVPAGRVVNETVATRRLAPTLLHLLDGESSLPGPILPGLGPKGLGPKHPPQPVYSEARMPASAYGWAALEAITDGDWRLIRAPRPELYDVAADPAEAHNLLTTVPAESRTDRAQASKIARRLRDQLEQLEAGFEQRRAAQPPADPELEAQLRSLGYLSTAPPGEGTIDPKDGIRLLADFRRAREMMATGNAAGAANLLDELVKKNPRNIPFRSRLGAAQFAIGRTDDAIATFKSAIELSPRQDFLHRNLADAYLQLGRLEEARAEYQLTLEINPRFAGAWLSLAEMAARAGQPAEEQRVLLEAVAAGTASAGIRVRLGQMELAADQAAAAEQHLEQATDLAPTWPLPWWLRGQAAEALRKMSAAAEYYNKVTDLAPNSAEGRAARQRLQSLPRELVN